MAKQDNEEKDRSGLMGALKRAPGYAYSKAMQAANAYGVASTIAGTFLGATVQPQVRTFMVAREGYDRHKRSEQIEERTSSWKAPEDDPDSKYDPKTDTTLHKVRPAFGSTAVTDAMFSPIGTLKRLLTRESGREGAEEPTELPQVVNAADLGISEPGEEGGVSTPTESGTESSDRAVNYGLIDGDSTAGMLQPMDEGVGEKRDVYGFPTDYEGDYDNAEKEWDAIHSQYVDMHNGRGNIKRDSPEGQALSSRFNYIAGKIDEANKRRTANPEEASAYLQSQDSIRSETSEERTDEHMRTFGTDTRQYDHYGFPSEYVAPSGRGMGGKWENAKDELEGHRNRTTGEIEMMHPDRIKYLEDLIKDAEKRKADSDSATPGGGQTSTGSSTIDTSRRQGYDRTNNRGITGALEISAIPHARSQELQNGRIVLQGRSYDIVGNTGDKFLVPSPDQPDYSRIS